MISEVDKKKLKCKYFGKFIDNPKTKNKCDKCRVSYECYLEFHENHIKRQK